MGIRQIIQREFRQCRKDGRRFVFLFGAALAYLLIFGVLYTPNIVKNIPCIIYDEEQSQLSRELVRNFEDSDSFSIVGYVDTQEKMQQALREKQAYAAIGIPRDFSKKIKTGGYSPFLFMVNGSNIILTNITSSAAQDIAAEFSNKLATRNAAMRLGANEELLAKRIAPVNCHLRVLHNPTQGYTYFFLLGLAMAAFQQGIFFAVGASTLYEYENCEEDIKAWKLIMGKLIYYWVLSMLSFAMVILMAKDFWGIFLKAPATQIFLLGGIFCFAAITFCMLVASLFHTEMQFVRGAIMYPVPAFIFSGYTWPRESMGPVMQSLASFFPLSWLSNTVREFFLSGISAHYIQSIEALLIIGFVCMAAVNFSFARGLKKHRGY
mgnify:FL=1